MPDTVATWSLASADTAVSVSFTPRGGGYYTLQLFGRDGAGRARRALRLAAPPGRHGAPRPVAPSRHMHVVPSAAVDQRLRLRRRSQADPRRA